MMQRVARIRLSDFAVMSALTPEDPSLFVMLLRVRIPVELTLDKFFLSLFFTLFCI